MPVNKESYQKILATLHEKNAALVAVSKTKSIADILELYELGQRDFGENYVQELLEKYEALPKDIRWHFIGHLQSNKVKLIAPFVYLIQGVDSEKLLKEINKEAKKNNRTIGCLLQVHIADEVTKFGFDEQEVLQFFERNVLNENVEKTTEAVTKYPNVLIRGLMGMASFTDDINKVRSEFKTLKSLFDNLQLSLCNSRKSTLDHQSEPSSFQILSMGMSADYKIAVDEGSNMVRIGSLLFGKRTKA